MQFLKALVVIMGVLIIAGFAVIGVELYKRMNDPSRGNPGANPSANPSANADPDRVATTPAGRTEEVGLDLPPGTRMGDPVAVGNRVVFRVTIPDGVDRLYVMDPRSGAISTTVTTGKATSSR
ncbi:hypothetical protein [Azospirillum canadense]|uniref:hypothetical protein n=1 Tax=Azospirillum canadense TaxID=403962 RepID=UPI002227C967|nr:hypothetical protein [Azospirillum canadense]MCW2236469.1 hypothetical protein [Azospirillum canadense]